MTKPIRCYRLRETKCISLHEYNMLSDLCYTQILQTIMWRKTLNVQDACSKTRCQDVIH